MAESKEETIATLRKHRGPPQITTKKIRTPHRNDLIGHIAG